MFAQIAYRAMIYFFRSLALSLAWPVAPRFLSTGWLCTGEDRRTFFFFAVGR
jgi:hypothetical protein